MARKLIRIDIKDDLFLNNKDKAADFVEKLQGAGFGIAIDGFGVGYASISRIVKVPADVVKIDRSLTASLLASDEEGLANFVRLAHESNKLVVVEGVETVEQFEKCCELDCDVVQGFLFSRPLLPEKAMQYKPHKFSVPKKRKGDKLPGRSTSPGKDSAPDDSVVSDDAADKSSAAPVPSPELETSTPAAADESAPTDDELPGRSTSPADEPAISDADSTAEALTASPVPTDKPSTTSASSPDVSVPTSRAAASGEDPAADASAVSGNAADKLSTTSGPSPDASAPTSRAVASGEDSALEHEQETLGEAAESEPEAPSASKMGASSGSDISAGSEPSVSASTEPASASELDATSADAESVSREGFGPK